MRRKKQQITDLKTLEAILNTADICRLAITDGNRPYILPFNFGYENRTLFIHAASEGRKLDLIRQNNIVGFEVDTGYELIKGERPCQWACQYQSVVGVGRVDVLTCPQDLITGLDIIMKHYGFNGKSSYEERYLDQMVILKVTIDEMTGKQSSHWGE